MIENLLSKTQIEILNKWLDEIAYPKAVEKQKKAYKKRWFWQRPKPVSGIMRECWEEGFPYNGAIGGGLTYEFSLTGLGYVIKAKYGDESIDLTEYEKW